MIMTNYRPISLLPSISKMIEKVAHNETRGPGALKLVNSIAKYQLRVCQRMYIYALNCIIMKIKYV